LKDTYNGFIINVFVSFLVNHNARSIFAIAEAMFAAESHLPCQVILVKKPLYYLHHLLIPPGKAGTSQTNDHLFICCRCHFSKKFMGKGLKKSEYAAFSVIKLTV